MIIFILLLCICIFLTIQYSLFLPSTKGLPILMYHKVSENLNDSLTISVDKLESQFEYLSQNGYRCIAISELATINNLPSKVFTLTFDDAYLNNLELAYPLLKKYNFHATIMLPVSFLGKKNHWDEGKEIIMNYDQLASLDSNYVSFGLHTYEHISLKNTSLQDIAIDIEKCKVELNNHGIDYLPVLAYPYGSYPKENEKKKQFFKLLESIGITHGFRIGNCVNKWPLRCKFEIKRIDIKGTDSFWMFKTKLQKGRVKLF